MYEKSHLVHHREIPHNKMLQGGGPGKTWERCQRYFPLDLPQDLKRNWPYKYMKYLLSECLLVSTKHRKVMNGKDGHQKDIKDD